MLNFRQVTLSDRAWIEPLIRNSGELGCEYSFGNIFMWSSLYATKIAKAGNFLTAEERVHCLSFLYPVGSGSDEELVELLHELREFAKQEGCPFRLHRVSVAGAERLERLLPGRFQLIAQRDDYDYIYRSEDLISLAGKKYHGKRNHIARFIEEYPDWSFEPITPDNAGECLALTRNWLAQHENADPVLLIEQKAIELGFAHFEQLGLVGGLLRCGGRVAAYTFGEPINERVFVTHVEKTSPDFNNAYPMINREFAARMLSGYELINREEDMGVEGLRKAKLSYHPHILYEKYVTVCKDVSPENNGKAGDTNGLCLDR